MYGFVFVLIVLFFVVIRALVKQRSADKRLDLRRRMMTQPAPTQFSSSGVSFPALSSDNRPLPSPARYVPPPPAPFVLPAIAPAALEQSAPQPSPAAALPDPEPTADPAVTDSATTERYVGSSALESTLDSTIESSLMGMPPGPITMAALPGAAVVPLPPEVEIEVIALMDARHEVAAVRLVCDAMDVGILEAVRSVRGLAGLPTP